MRGRKQGVLVADMKGEALHGLVVTHGWRSYIVCSTGEARSMALVLDVGKNRIRPPPGVQQHLLAEAPVGAVQRMLEAPVPRWTTIKLSVLQKLDTTDGNSVSRDTLIDIIRGYLHMNPVEWNAEIWALNMKPPASLTTAERYIASEPIHAQKVREALIQQEGAKAFVRFIADVKALAIGKFVDLDKLLAVRITPDGNRSSMGS